MFRSNNLPGTRVLFFRPGQKEKNVDRKRQKISQSTYYTRSVDENLYSTLTEKGQRQMNAVMPNLRQFCERRAVDDTAVHNWKYVVYYDNEHNFSTARMLATALQEQGAQVALIEGYYAPHFSEPDLVAINVLDSQTFRKAMVDDLGFTTEQSQQFCPCLASATLMEVAQDGTRSYYELMSTSMATAGQFPLNELVLWNNAQ